MEKSTVKRTTTFKIIGIFCIISLLFCNLIWTVPTAAGDNKAPDSKVSNLLDLPQLISLRASSENKGAINIDGVYPNKGNPKLDSALNDIVSKPRLPLTASVDVSEFPTEEQTIRVIVECIPDSENEAEEASSKAGIVETEYNGLLQVNLPISRLSELSDNTSIQFIRLPYQAVPTIISEGVSLINAAQWKEAGYNGSGVKIGVLDSGFSGYTALQSQGELPTSITTWWAPSLGGPGSEIHGAACAEIIYDVAPGATYYFANIATEVEYGNAVDWLIAQGVNVISCSIGFPGLGPGDGTGPIGQIVDRAYNAGILWSQSAGNSAQRHWSGSWIDSNANGYLDFASGDEGNDISVVTGETIAARLNWSDTWGASANDYDLLLFNNIGNLVSYSANVQNGTGNPYEFFSYTATSSGTYAVKIVKYGSPAVRAFNLYITYQNLQYKVAAGSICVPADSTHVMTVGAVPWNTPATIESFSSQGPSTSGVIKPDLIAPDYVSTVTYGTTGFSGTSASAPCAAGAAAIVKGAFPSYTQIQLKAYLEGNAVDLGTAGKDNIYGSGRLLLGNPSGNISFITAPQSKTAGTISNVITVQFQNSTGTPINVVSNTDINLTSSSNTGKFDTSASGLFNGSVTKVTIPYGSNSANFYYKDTTSGTPTLTAISTGMTSGTQQETITPGAATTISIFIPPVIGASVDANLAAQPVILVMDSDGNPISGITVIASRGTGTGTLRGTLTATSDITGKATFTDLGYNKAGEAFTIHFAAGNLTADSASLVPLAVGAAVQVGVETFADGFSVVVPAENITAGNSLTVYAVARDQYENFVTNTAGNWSLTGRTRGVADTDLVPGEDNQSAVFTGHKIGTVVIHVTSNGLSPGDSGVLTVIPAAAAKIGVETFANGSGSVVPAQNIIVGNSITAYSVSRDLYCNFVSNSVGSWSLVDKNDLVDTDLLPSADNKSAVFTGNSIGSAVIHVNANGLNSTDSGIISAIPTLYISGYISPVVAGSVDNFTVTAMDNATAILTGYRGVVHFISSDILADIPADYTFVSADNGTHVFQAVLKTAGSQSITSTDTANPGITGSQNGINVTPGTKNKLIWGIQPVDNITAGAHWTSFSVVIADQYVNPTAATDNVTITASSDVVIGTLIQTALDGLATFNDIVCTLAGTLTLTGSAGTLINSPTSHLITVQPASSSQLIWVTQPPAVMTAGANWPDFIVEIVDQYGNPTAAADNVTIEASSGSLNGTLTRSVVAGFATFSNVSRNLAGSLTLTVESGALSSLTSGSILVNPAAASQVRAESAANGSGNLIPAQDLTIGNSLPVYAVSRDQFNNFIANPDNTTWSLISVAGGVIGSDLNTTQGNNVTMTGHQVGSGVIHPAISGLTSIDSSIITVRPVVILVSGSGGGVSNQPPPSSPIIVITSGLQSSIPLMLDNFGQSQSSVELKTTDGNGLFQIAQNTLLTDSNNLPLTNLSVQTLASPPQAPPENVTLMAYEFSPEGASFNPAITLTLFYDSRNLPQGVQGDTLALVHWDGSKWVAVESHVDSIGGKITAQISHFSQYAVIAKYVPPARFIFSDFKITPLELKPGELATVHVILANTGGSTGQYKVILKINGTEAENREFTLAANSNKAVNFELTRNSPGEYSVDLNGNTGRFLVVAPPTPKPEITAFTPVAQVLETVQPALMPIAVPLETSQLAPSASSPVPGKSTTPIWIVVGVIGLAGIVILILLFKRRTRQLGN